MLVSACVCMCVRARARASLHIHKRIIYRIYARPSIHPSMHSHACIYSSIDRINPDPSIHPSIYPCIHPFIEPYVCIYYFNAARYRWPPSVRASCVTSCCAYACPPSLCLIPYCHFNALFNRNLLVCIILCLFACTMPLALAAEPRPARPSACSLSWRPTWAGTRLMWKLIWGGRLPML